MPPSGGGCREPSPGQKRARSWPFGLPSSRLRPSACALRLLCNVRHRVFFAALPGGFENLPAMRPGAAETHVQGQCTTQEIALQLPTVRARSAPGPWITAPLALAFDGPRSLGDLSCVNSCSERAAFGDQELRPWIRRPIPRPHGRSPLSSRPKTAHDSGNRPAVTHRPGIKRAWPVDNCTARFGPLLGPARWTIFHA